MEHNGFLLVVGPPSGAAGGDLSGTYPNPTIAKIQGNPVNASGILTGGDALVWNGALTQWQPSEVINVVPNITILKAIAVPAQGTYFQVRDLTLPVMVAAAYFIGIQILRQPI